MADKPEFQRKQYEFAAHIRDPEHVKAPQDVEERRMRIYRQLFFNNLLSLLSSTFPVLTRLHDDARWRGIIREFMVRHEAQTPYFLEIPKEFLQFLETEYEPGDDDFPFLKELAHYEWVELALSVSEASNDFERVDPEGDLLEQVPVKSNLAWSLSYEYPVHRIDHEYQPDAPGEQPTYLAIFRNTDDELGFMELNPVTARLLQLIEHNDDNRTGRELLLQLTEEMKYPDADAFLAHGEDALEQMRQSQILIGVAK
jgi:hypothetical protein